MLDLYLLDDGLDVPESPEEDRLTHLGTVGKQEFRDLQKLGVLSLKQNFWSEFRWDSKKVAAILAALQTNQEIGTSGHEHFYKPRLMEILTAAVKQSAGIVAYQD